MKSMVSRSHNHQTINCSGAQKDECLNTLFHHNTLSQPAQWASRLDRILKDLMLGLSTNN